MMVQFDVKRVKSGSESFMVSFDFNKTPVTQIADYIIIAASKHNTSDIHFDPRDEGMMVRFRIDGDCQDYTFVPKAYEKNLTTRLKLLANMNITESRLPQDGAIKGEFGGQYLDMRVSALPLNTGEKIVIRILDYTRSLQGIDSLGFHPKNLEKIKRMMGLPNGIILTTGATGSGKSTTTYSILQGLNKPETNVITVEDPIEMNIEGINQVQVNADIGMTFAAALRSILRQDPNVILIGEIRDSETAQIAVRASITGHLVLSTIHTNNALATVERLLDMNVERYLLSTALSGIISQRLAKMLCTECKIKRPTTKYEKKVFKKYMKMDVDEVWDANPKGCEDCRRGYHGRIAVHEVLELTDELKAAISSENLEKEELAKKVYGSGTITMLQDALIKCLEGKTSFGEVYKTIEIENEDDDNYESEIENEIKEAIKVQEEPKVSDDLLETIVEEGHAEVFVPAVITAAAFSDKDDTADENAGKPIAQPHAPKNKKDIELPEGIATPIPVEQEQVEVPVEQTQSVIPTEQSTTESAVEQSAVNVIATTPTTIIPNPVENNNIVATIPVQAEQVTPVVPQVNIETATVPNISVAQPEQAINAEVNNVVATPVTGIQKLEDTPIVDNQTGIPTVVVPKVADNQGVTSNPMDINTLPSVQTGAVSIVNNTSTLGLPMTAGIANLPLVTSQQTTNVPMIPNVVAADPVQQATIPIVPQTVTQPQTTLPVRNDTVIEAMQNSSITAMAPTNTYINPVPVTGQVNNNSVVFDTKNDVSLPTVFPDSIAPGGNVGATDFLVQKPLMPTNFVKAN